MTADRDLDPRLAGLFSRTPAPLVPDRVLAAALERIDVVPQDHGLRLHLGDHPRPSSRWRAALGAVAILALLVGVVVAGAWLIQHSSPSGPRLLVVRALGPEGSGSGVAVVAIGRDGSEATLANFDQTRLGGPWTGQDVRASRDGRIAIPTSVGAADSQFAIVDLRDPTATPGYPDAVGGDGAWTGDGRFGVKIDGETFAVYDTSTGQTVPVASVAVVSRPYDGLGARRERPDGTIIHEPPALQARHPLERIVDRAAARDGGLWVLLETRATGPRTVSLVHASADGGTDRDIASFTVPPPDPDGYAAVSSFAAMAPDDGQIVIGTISAGAPGPTYLVDPATGRVRTLVEGKIAGWIGPDDLRTPRRGAGPLEAASTELRGEWARAAGAEGSSAPAGASRLRIGYTQAVVSPDFGRRTLGVRADGPDRLRFTEIDAGPDCGVGSTGTYAWTIAGDRLTLIPSSEACGERRDLLAGQFERNLPYRGNWEPRVEGGATFLVPELAIRLTIPSTGDAYVWDHSDTTISLAGRESDLWILTRVDRGSAKTTECLTTDITGGLDGVLAYLDTLPPSGVTFEDRSPMTVDGLPAVRGTVRGSASDDSCGGWPTSAGGWSVNDGETLTLIEAPGERVYSILARGDPAWADAVTASLEFVGD